MERMRRARIPKAELISLSEKPNFNEEELGPEGWEFQETFFRSIQEDLSLFQRLTQSEPKRSLTR
jgi:hypothetical protein